MLFVDPALEQQGFPVFVRPSHRDHPDYMMIAIFKQ